ncbi:hypothetical protein CYY_002796 [Polysphondylium violaceum]|uniref:non-specific serine/threonine protein kinase n=1 Tax=Polysphondylium violaceum TaxID=133409 RepID=A0A8J4PYR9_9MYCE|nr:hypothetical protein CYY_002796 [Polysphondylium violaceum]
MKKYFGPFNTFCQGPFLVILVLVLAITSGLVIDVSAFTAGDYVNSFSNRDNNDDGYSYYDPYGYMDSNAEGSSVEQSSDSSSGPTPPPTPVPSDLSLATAFVYFSGAKDLCNATTCQGYDLSWANGYACGSTGGGNNRGNWDDGVRTFKDPMPPNAIIKDIGFILYGTFNCDSTGTNTQMYFLIQQTSIGNQQEIVSETICLCGNCYANYSIPPQAVMEGLNYNHTGVNKLSVIIINNAICLTKIQINFYYYINTTTTTTTTGPSTTGVTTASTTSSTTGGSTTTSDTTTGPGPSTTTDTTTDISTSGSASGSSGHLTTGKTSSSSTASSSSSGHSTDTSGTGQTTATTTTKTTDTTTTGGQTTTTTTTTSDTTTGGSSTPTTTTTTTTTATTTSNTTGSSTTTGGNNNNNPILTPIVKKWLIIAGSITGGVIIATVLIVYFKKRLKRRGYVKIKDGKNIDIKQIRLGERIGKGNFGEVYKGYWRGSQVAIKKLPAHNVKENVLKEFHREIELMKNLRHPNVIQFLGSCTIPPDICICTEYMPRGSLYGILHNEQIQLPWALVIRMCIDAARGIIYLHSSNPVILHRDLKSHNLLVEENWKVKVGDFGLSTIEQTTATMTACGTPCWTAPEVLRNQRYTEKADVYSFGIVLWECATRCDPYAGIPPFQVIFAVGREGLRPPTPKSGPPEFIRIITECLSENPQQRPSMESVLNRLESIDASNFGNVLLPPPTINNNNNNMMIVNNNNNNININNNNNNNNNNNRDNSSIEFNKNIFSINLD